MLVRYYKGFLSSYASHTPCVVQTAKCTPCIILHTSWIPGERVYDVGVFRVLDVYKYAQRLLEAAHGSFSTFTLPGFSTHPHSHKKKGGKLKFDFCRDDHDSGQIAIQVGIFLGVPPLQDVKSTCSLSAATCRTLCFRFVLFFGVD